SIHTGWGKAASGDRSNRGTIHRREGVGRGYLNRAQITAEKFVPDPFSRVSEARLYRTGDLARYRADGKIEFLGRIDDQVKVRGYRIELGEIEGVLSEHEAVKESVVIVSERAGGDKQIVGFVVCEPGSGVTERELKSYLRERLPDYMVPGALVELERLPLTANGKVDKQALMGMRPVREAGAGEASREATPVEEVVRGVWEEVLGREGIGLRENFFDLGGHSLLATRVMARIREALGVEIGLREIFDKPSVEELSVALEREMRGGGEEKGEEGIKAKRREGLVPLSYAQQRMWILNQMEPENAVYNITSGIRLKGELEAGALG